MMNIAIKYNEKMSSISFVNFKNLILSLTSKWKILRILRDVIMKHLI